MGELQFEHLFDLSIDVAGLTLIGQTFNGHRLIADVGGGTVEGPRLKGTVLTGASGDWIVVRKGGVSVLDVRITIESDDGALILMKYHGFRHGPREVLKRLDAGEKVDPSEYYMRIAPSFETGDERYYWMNNIVAVGMGEARAKGPRYSVHQVL
ncbi:DUF3237 domain-containing protein [Minwuia thermotolerans]|uniref:UPF0311 protein CVT23_15735 n=1 Tax=Minwuia thermotolerans TaxID=2056226 RepID=A0A2M9FZ84_9PROT|nr:DUF3237 domain-containing protein [Minwuia thermotolerans]PJK28781.1 DUF3237 domain-containing protein [Minwuia thermotolerans]